MAANLKAIAKRMKAAAAEYPEAKLDHPWGEDVYKVGGKVFVFFGIPGDKLGFSVKLPNSSGAALMLPFAEPTGYGLGRAGWVTAMFEKDDEVPEGLLLEWLGESYRAVAPKKLLKTLDAPAEAPKVKPKRKRS